MATASEQFIFEETFVDELKKDQGLFRKLKKFFHSFIRRIVTGQADANGARQALYQALGIEGQEENLKAAINLWMDGFRTEASAEEHADVQEEYAERMALPGEVRAKKRVHGVLSSQDFSEFYNLIAGINRGNEEIKTPEGYFALGIGNKVVVTDGDFLDPSIEKGVCF